MKSIRQRSHEQGRLGSRVSQATKHTISSILSPFNFEQFFPWLCLQLQVPKLIIINRLSSGIT